MKKMEQEVVSAVHVTHTRSPKLILRNLNNHATNLLTVELIDHFLIPICVQLMKKMSSTDTPLGTVTMLQQKQKESHCPYVVLSGSKQLTS
jgi:hypothetical protein